MSLYREGWCRGLAREWQCYTWSGKQGITGEIGGCRSNENFVEQIREHGFYLVHSVDSWDVFNQINKMSKGS